MQPVDENSKVKDLQLIVRRVLPVDLRATSELLVWQLKQRGRPGDVEHVRNAVQTALEDQHGVLVVGAYHEGQPGFAHGKMVGVLLMNALLSVEQAGEVGWIETLFVRPEYRRRGLAERLLQQALTWANARGLRSLDLEVAEDHDNEAATKLYAKYGFGLIQRSRMSCQLGR